MSVKNLIVSLILGVLLSRSTPTHTQCVATATLRANSISANTGTGTMVWFDLSGGTHSDNSHVWSGALLGVFSSANTNYLMFKGFNISLPLYASICGVEVDIEQRAGGLGIGGAVRENVVRLMKNNVITGNNLAQPGALTSTDQHYLHGGASETWGTTWTAADINSPGFGVAISARTSTGVVSLLQTAEIDQVTVRVYYNVTVLPVRLLSFQATTSGNGVDVNWQTAAEYNLSHFILQRSLDNGRNWTMLDSVAASAPQGGGRGYTHRDQTPGPENLYRLKMVDQDGSFRLSAVSRVVVLHRTSAALFPNPSTGQVHVRSDFPIRHILISDLAGRVVYESRPLSGDNQQEISLHHLDAGLYSVKVVGDKAYSTIMLSRVK